MPNHTKIEAKLLTPEQAALVNASRPPALTELDEAALYQLISDLAAAKALAGPRGTDGEVLLGDIFSAAERRAQAERRKRGLKPAGAKPAAKAAQDATTTPAAKATSKRAPASPARKPAGRAKSETRKTDLRTASRRVAKPSAKVTPALPTALVPLMPPAPKPMDELSTDTDLPVPQIDTPPAVEETDAPAVLIDGKKAKTKGSAKADDDKARKKAVKKAAKKAADNAEKDARKAAKKAEKEAVSAARKAAKQAAKAADKAARKATRKAAKKEQPPV